MNRGKVSIYSTGGTRNKLDMTVTRRDLQAVAILATLLFLAGLALLLFSPGSDSDYRLVLTVFWGAAFGMLTSVAAMYLRGKFSKSGKVDP